MTFDQLKSFLAIVKYNHFTLASQELYISQSSISKHIKALEKELGVELFNRQHRSIKLTDAGKDFYQFAYKSMNDYNNILSNMKKYSCEESNSISIGVIDIMVEYGIATLISDFQREYPNIQIDLVERTNSKIIKYLDESIINLAFINSNNKNKTSLILNEIENDDLVLVTSNKHRLASKSSINIFNTAKDKYICINGDYYLHNVFLNTWGNLNYFPNTLYIDSQTKTLLALVSENMGITLLPYKVATSYKKNIDNSIHICKLENNFSTKLYLGQLKNKKLSKNETIFKNFAFNWFNKKLIKEESCIY